MSWNFAIHQINRSFEQIAQWYHEFMHRAENSFRALHERIEYLEQRQAWQGPSDEQVERILRRILAEKFADAGVQTVENPNAIKDDACFVKPPSNDASIPKPIALDAERLRIDPDAVPSKAYAESFQMLDKGLQEFPKTDVGQSAANNRSDDSVFKRPQHPNHANPGKPW